MQWLFHLPQSSYNAKTGGVRIVTLRGAQVVTFLLIVCPYVLCEIVHPPHDEGILNHMKDKSDEND